jgi:hypothetical protein
MGHGRFRGCVRLTEQSFDGELLTPQLSLKLEEPPTELLVARRVGRVAAQERGKQRESTDERREVGACVHGAIRFRCGATLLGRSLCANALLVHRPQNVDGRADRCAWPP